MANQPVFRADPNAVPQIDGWPGVLNSIQKGYQLAQLPQQMKMQQMLQAAQLQKYQAETQGQNLSNQYYGQEAEGRIAASKAGTDYQNLQASRYNETVNSALARDRALNAETQARTGLTNEQILATRFDRQQQQAIYDALKAAQNGQQQPSPQGNNYYDTPQPSPQPQYQPGQGGAMYAPPSAQGMNQPAPQQMPQGGAPAQQATAPSGDRVIQPGSKDRAYLDDFASNPVTWSYLKKLNISPPTTKTQYNATSGQIITTTTWPSGKITANATQLTNGNNGIQVSTDENGRPIVKIGGSSSGRGQGGLGTDADGNLISLPTTATQTNLQQRSIGEELAQPYLNDIVNNLPQFQNIFKRGLTEVQGGLNSVGADFDAPSQKAKGEAAITTASEGLLKSFGLYGAGANREAVEATLQPKRGESVEGYKRRIIDYINTTIGNASRAKKNLGGIKVNDKTNNPEQAAVNQINQDRVKQLVDSNSLDQLQKMLETAQ